MTRSPPNRSAPPPHAWAWVPALVPLAAWLGLGPELLVSGGLAPLGAAALIAGFVALPVALADWQAPATAPPWERAAAQVTLTMLVAATLAAASPALSPWIVLAVAAVVWWAAARGPGEIRHLAPLTCAVMVVGVAAALFSSPGAPLTAAVPHWSGASDWVAAAVVIGLLLPAPLLGLWTTPGKRRPGAGRLPWAAAGIGMFLVLAAVGVHAAIFETTGQMTGPVSAGLSLAVGALMGFALPGQLPSGSSRGPALAGLAGTAWFVGPGAGALPIWWSVLLPGIVGAMAAGRVARGARDLPLAGVAVLGLGAAAWGWPGLPPSSIGAACVAFTVVALVWMTGHRAISLEAR